MKMETDFLICHVLYITHSQKHAVYNVFALISSAHSVRQCLLLDSDRNKILCTDGPIKNGSRAGSKLIGACCQIVVVRGMLCEK